MFSLLPYFLMPDVAKRSKCQSFVDLLWQIEVSAITSYIWQMEASA